MPAYTLTGTVEHPFFVPVRGQYVPMAELGVGDGLMGQEGNRAVVVGAEVRSVRAEVFNLEVSDAHNYNVGVESVVGSTVLVHNAPCDSLRWIDPRDLLPRQIPVREMSSREIDRIKKSMLQHGFDVNYPIKVVSDGNKFIILDGHHRQRAAILGRIKLVATEEVTVSPDKLIQMKADAVEAIEWYGEYLQTKGRWWGQRTY